MRVPGVHDHNRAFAVDGRVGLGETALISGFAALTATPGGTGHERALQIGFSNATPTWRGGLVYSEVGEQFNPEVGPRDAHV